MLKKIVTFLLDYRFLFILYVTATLVAGFQNYYFEVTTPADQLYHAVKFNNYLIFKYSFLHLLDGKNLYVSYWPGEHWDLFKYTPTFALFFGLFAWMPDWLGLTLWNLVNAMVFFIAVWNLPGPDERKRGLILLFSLSDMLNSLQNSQSNTLIAGLLLLGFVLMERRKFFPALLCIAATFFIKIFGIAALLLVLCYPGRAKHILYAAGAFVLLLLLPLPITGFAGLITHYRQYLELLQADQAASWGLSVMGIVKSWFGTDLSKTALSLTGILLVSLPLLKGRRYSEQAFRIAFLALLMIWMVIFNHRAESPTYIVATAGIYTWVFTRNTTWYSVSLLLLTLLFSTLSATDLFPPFVREQFFEPFQVKAIPCLLAFLIILATLLRPAASQPARRNPGM